MRVISFSLWGKDDKYLQGALINAELAQRWYPGWQCRFYVGTSVPDETVVRLDAHPHTQIVRKDTPGDWRGMLWRFCAGVEQDVEAVIFRDADSRIGPRERDAVQDWLSDDRTFHVMRDHPAHSVPVLGGMWGVRPSGAPWLGQALREWKANNRYQTDQDFLAANVGQRMGEDVCVHDEWFCGDHFPTARTGNGWVGESFDDDGKRDSAAVRQINEALHPYSKTRRLIRRLGPPSHLYSSWPGAPVFRTSLRRMRFFLDGLGRHNLVMRRTSP